MKVDIHAIIEMLHSDPAGISMKFGIPLRTVYGWCKGNRTPPDYLINMMLNIILLEKRISSNIKLMDNSINVLRGGLTDGNSKEGLEVGMGSNIEGITEACKESKSENGKT